MPEYVFGNPRDHYSSYRAKAKNIDIAIKIFKTDVLFPEKYVAKKYIIDNDEDEYKFKDNPLIYVQVLHKKIENDYDKYKIVKKLTLEECININYEDILPKKDIQLLETTYIQSENDEQISELPVIRNVHHVKTLNKQELRTATLEIKEKKREMEAMIQELNESLTVMKEEIAQKMKLLTAFELFLGVHEEIYELKAGELASENEPLTVYQQILYMDEEYGAYENQGLDKNDLDIFDKWITENYDKFLYAKKSICVWRVRRNRKKYSEDAFINALMNDGNWDTYFLIRNGENIYRMWAGIRIHDRLFPALKEYEEFLNDKNGFGDKEYRQKELKEKHQEYMLGLIYIQGLIERTTVFGTRLKTGINLLTGHFTEKDIILVRDDEQNLWITDGKPNWREFTKKNMDTIKVGTRIIIIKVIEKAYDRTVANTWEYPSRKEIHIVTEVNNDKWSDSVKIKYQPGGTVYHDWSYESHERKNRASFELYFNEILNIDAITLEDIEYYLHNRLERPHYLSVMPALYYAKHVKIEEEKIEKEFRLLILGQMGWNTDKEQLVKDAVLWWKLKNKWRRPLSADESKAVRMIVRKLKK